MPLATRLAPRPEKLPLQLRMEAVASVAAERRTVEVVFTTGAAVRRSRYDGWDSSVPFDEILLVTDAAVDLTRLKAGAPVLDSHRIGSTDAQRAVVEDAWIKAGKGLARLRFPKPKIDAASDRLFELVRDKIIRNVSVGYAINSIRVEEAKRGEVERHIVERWTPYELSFVTVPADAGAQTRSHAQSFPVTFVGGSHARHVETARARMAMRSRAAGLPESK